jgi:hypothetical protein
MRAGSTKTRAAISLESNSAFEKWGTATAKEEVGIGQHFRLSYKMLSKFAHPAAMRILAPPDEARNALQPDCFFSQGCLYFRDAFDSLGSQLAGAA